MTNNRKLEHKQQLWEISFQFRYLGPLWTQNISYISSCTPTIQAITECIAVANQLLTDIQLANVEKTLTLANLNNLPPLPCEGQLRMFSPETEVLSEAKYSLSCPQDSLSLLKYVKDSVWAKQRIWFFHENGGQNSTCTTTLLFLPVWSQ